PLTSRQKLAQVRLPVKNLITYPVESDEPTFPLAIKGDSVGDSRNQAKRNNLPFSVPFFAQFVLVAVHVEFLHNRTRSCRRRNTAAWSELGGPYQLVSGRAALNTLQTIHSPLFS